MDCSMPWFLHYHPEFAHIHVYLVDDATEPSHHLLPSSPFSFHLSQHQAFFPVNFLFTSGGQSIGASASALALIMNIQCCFPLGLTGLIFLQSKGLSRIFSSTTTWRHKFFGSQPSLWPNSHIHTWLLEKPVNALTMWIFVYKIMSLLFNTLSRFV